MPISESFSWIPRAVRIYGLLCIFSLACLVLGYQLEHWHAHSMAVHIVNELGVAGLIGFLLAITIEKLSQDEFRKLAEKERAIIKKDVFYYVYGHEIPPAIRDEIDARILRSPFVRRGVIMQYQLEPIEDPATHEWYVLVTFTMKYDIENLTAEEQKFRLIASIDKSPSEEFANRTKFVSLSAKGCKVPGDWDEAQLKSVQIESDTDYTLDLPNQIVVLPRQPAREDMQVPAAPNLTTVTLITHTVRFLNGGHIDFTFTSHICDLNLIIQSDNRLKVVARTSEQNPLQIGEVHSPNSNLYNWTLRRPLLAYQSLQISWTPQGIPATVVSLPNN